MSHVYFLQRDDGIIKIGTTTNYESRLVKLRNDYGNLTLLGLIEGDWQDEQRIHAQFRHLRAERFEWFHPGEELLDFIKTQKLLPPPEVPPYTGNRPIKFHSNQGVDRFLPGVMKAAGGEIVTMLIKPELALLIDEFAEDKGLKTGEAIDVLLRRLLREMRGPAQDIYITDPPPPPIERASRYSNLLIETQRRLYPPVMIQQKDAA